MTYEDFTTYTEVDESADITVIANKITVDTMLITANSYVTKSHGANHFGNFEHKIDVRFTVISTTNFTGFWGISNSYYTLLSMDNNNEGMHAWIANVGGDYRIYIKDYTNNNIDFYGGLALSTSYYTTIKRDGTTLTCKIYSDSARTVLLDTLTIICTNTTYSNVIPMSGYDNTVNGRTSTYTVDNLDLQEGETHAPSDTAKASDSLTFKAEVPIADTAKVNDSLIFSVEEHIADTAKTFDSLITKTGVIIGDIAKASDDLTLQVETSLSDTAKASDSVNFFKGLRFAIGDIAKASDSLITKAYITLVDIAKVSDSVSFFTGIFKRIKSAIQSNETKLKAKQSNEIGLKSKQNNEIKLKSKQSNE
jgi:hypothetical protein